jgi:hypothetical protein
MPSLIENASQPFLGLDMSVTYDGRANMRNIVSLNAPK